MKIRPLHDCLVVRRLEPPAVTPAGIRLLPHVDDGFVKELVRGEVLDVGPGKRGESMWGLKPGDKVAFSPVLAHDTGDATIIKRNSVAGTLL